MDNQTPSTQTSSNSMTDTNVLSGVRTKINNGIDSATNRIGEVVEGKANAISSKTQDLLTSVAHGGQYLREHEPKALGADLMAVIKRHPVLTLAIGAGCGMFVAKMLRR